MRYAKKIDANQHEIVKALRARHISVAPEHDDILVGYRGKTWWFELKDEKKLFLKDGVTFRAGSVTEGQSRLRSVWRGHYAIVWKVEQILETIGYAGE